MFDWFANVLTFGMLGLDPSSRMGAAMHFFIMGPMEANMPLKPEAAKK